MGGDSGPDVAPGNPRLTGGGLSADGPRVPGTGGWVARGLCADGCPVRDSPKRVSSNTVY